MDAVIDDVRDQVCQFVFMNIFDSVNPPWFQERKKCSEGIYVCLKRVQSVVDYEAEPGFRPVGQLISKAP